MPSQCKKNETTAIDPPTPRPRYPEGPSTFTLLLLCRQLQISIWKVIPLTGNPQWLSRFRQPFPRIKLGTPSATGPHHCACARHRKEWATESAHSLLRLQPIQVLDMVLLINTMVLPALPHRGTECLPKSESQALM